MNNFEDQLRHALQREAAPAGFEARLARRMHWRPLRLLAAAAVLVGALAGGWHQHVQRVEGERARAQLLLALEVSSEKLNAAFQKIVPPEERP